MSLTAKRVREVLSYDRKTGLFVWRVDRRRFGPGTPAGHRRKDGYVNIVIDGRPYKAHRIAWLYVTGEWPENDIDHKDRNKSNNRWTNLREATDSQNMTNRPRSRNNTSGFKGVARQEGKWTAYVYKEKKRYYLGLFDTIDDAVRARLKRVAELHGAFAAG